jgi:hypothetical protein
MKKIKEPSVVVIEVDESEEITFAVRAEDLLEGDTTDPWRSSHRHRLTPTRRC